jgi:hypothetical protein
MVSPSSSSLVFIKRGSAVVADDVAFERPLLAFLHE